MTEKQMRRHLFVQMGSADRGGEVKELLGKLKEAAAKATPGPWEFICSQDEQRGYILADKEWCEDMAANVFRKTIANICTGPAQSNGVYIALCSPENVLKLCEALEDAKALAEKIKTLSVRANTFGPGMPETYADATWMLGQEARAFLSKWATPGEGETS